MRRERAAQSSEYPIFTLNQYADTIPAGDQGLYNVLQRLTHNYDDLLVGQKLWGGGGGSCSVQIIPGIQQL